MENIFAALLAFVLLSLLGSTFKMYVKDKSYISAGIILTCAIFLMLSFSTYGEEKGYGGTYVWAGAISKHFLEDSDDFNEKHGLIAIQHNKWILGYNPNNSQKEDNVLLGRIWTWRLHTDWSGGFIGGATYGYKDCSTAGKFNKGERDKPCAMAMLHIEPTNSDFQPVGLLSVGFVGMSARYRF